MTKKLIATLFLTTLSFGSAYSFESVNTSSTGFRPEDRAVKKDSLMSGNFGFQTNDIIEDVGDVPGNKNFGSLNIKYQSFNENNVYKGFEIKSQINDQEVLQYSIKEALVEFRYSNSRFAIGRTTLDWSHADEVWGLGKINNRVNFDYFEPEQEGLIGMFYDKKFGNGFDVGIFGSFVYVPEMSQGMVIDKDKRSVVCKTLWCDAPSASAEIQGRDVPIHYDVNYPEMSDVVMKYSLGMKLGFSSDKFTLNTYYLRKPENGLSVIAEVSVPAAVTEINVNVTPQFYYHDVKGANAEINFTENFKVYGSYLNIAPQNFPDGNTPYIQYTGIKPNKKKEEYLSGGMKFSNEDFKSHLGYIARVSEFDTENEILVDYPRWNQAVHLALSKNLSRKIFVGLDYKYDTLTEDRLTMFKTSYSFGPSVVATVGVNIIGTNDSKSSYWSKFENNDSVYSSLKYTF